MSNYASASTDGPPGQRLADPPQRRASDGPNYRRILLDPGLSYSYASIYLLVAIGYLLDPTVVTRTPVGQAVHPYEVIWVTLYIIGAALVFASSRSRNRSLALEATGMVVLMGGWAINGALSLFVQGPLDTRSYIYLVLIVFAAKRVQRIAHVLRS